MGVGVERAAQLERLGVRTVGDLLLLRPRRHEDRRHGLRLVELRGKGPATARGRVVAAGVKRFRGGNRSVYELVLDDGTARLHCRWWNMPYLEGRFAVGEDVMAYGRLVDLKPRTMDHPETEVLAEDDEVSIHLDRIVPVYPLTEGLPQRWMRSRLWALVSALAAGLPEPRPELDRADLPTRADAVRWLHFPEDMTDVEVARRRLAYDEFVELQWAIQTRRQTLFASVTGLPCGGEGNRWIRPFLERLGFKLTESQTTVLRDIRRDLGGGRPMRRLVQGDVGSGKTVVAACAALMALESGFGVALMAPTEILARQHAERFREWFTPLGIPVVLRTGAGVDGNEAARVGLTVGTHALLASGYLPDDLGLVVIDEQHKFGVSQRETLVRKGRYPHLLVMTATPIPRTLALTLYGDLDCSVIEQAPAGRGRVRTFVRTARGLGKVWEFVRKRLAEGRQAYVVYARVDDDGAGEVKAVTREWRHLCATLAPHAVGLVHGRLSSAEKETVMAEFRAGRVQVLVATLVIEVGVDVPNATVMVIENAEQFGLAQLHQLRGRIGRGGHEGTCILVAGRETEASRVRLRVLEECADGFAIAERDLRLRGPGELLGQAQSGLPALRFGDLTRDAEWVERARQAVAKHLGQ
ncbi:MAG: ATP-dependent DNA helicase RecG [Verrucomicrobiales bacterium]|nr:ATP-dependent DNA helicase RecG [Verrucomicrobiales bacterium]